MTKTCCQEDMPYTLMEMPQSLERGHRRLSPRIAGVADAPNSLRSNESSIAPALWPLWNGENMDDIDAEAMTAVRTTLSREVEIRVRLSEMEAKGLKANGSFLETADLQNCNFSQRMSIIKTTSRLQPFVMHPTSTPILIWHIIGPFLLAYDIIMIPLKAFPIPEHWALDVVAITITSYWSLDTVRGFFTGFEIDNSVEMRPSVIASRYLRSWFFLDVTTCCLDWAFIIGGSGGMFNKFWRTSRAVQAWRILRLVRLVRVVKFVNKVTAIVDQVLSLQVLIAIKSVYIAMAVGFFCHYMACYWYFIGDFYSENLNKQSWLKEYKLVNADLSELYSTSFHWALAQSGFGLCDLYPTNTAERTYASCSSFLWLIIVSVTINLFHIWLSQLRDMNKDRELQRIHLRKYLEEHDVSRKLTYKVLRYFRMNYRQHRRRVHEEDISFLRDLPLALKIGLHKEVNLPILKSHIFFQFLGNVCESLPVIISHLAMSETHYLAGDNVFREGNAATHLLYVQVGRLDYYAVRQNMRCSKLKPGDWACEPALWLRWVLRGRLVSGSSSELMGIDVDRFHAIVQDAKGRGEDVNTIRAYATALCEHMVSCNPNTDIWRDFETMQNKADEAIAAMHRAYVRGDDSD